MPEQLQKILNRIVEWWKKFNNKQRILLGSIAGAVLLALGILAFIMTRPNMVVIYSASTMAEAAEISTLLKDQGIDFDTADGGKTFSVDTKDEFTASYALAQSNYPAAPYSSEDAINTSMSATSSDKEKVWIGYLEKKLSSDLSNQNGIEDAKVTITLPDDDGTILSGDDEATASLALTLSDTLSEEQAYGIALVVSTALGNDTTEGIVIVDQNNNILYSGKDSNSASGIMSSNLTNKQKNMEIVTEQVKEALKSIYTNVNVGLNLDMDYSTKEESKHEYYAPDGKDDGMIGSSSTYNASGTNVDSSDVPGTDSNDDTTYVIGSEGNSSYEVSDVDLVYENNELVTITKDNGGNIKKESSSITVTATRYENLNEATLKANGKLDELSYEDYKELNSNPYTEEADQTYIEAIANATGISADKITLISNVQPVYLDDEGSGITLNDIAQIVLAVLIFALLGYVVFRSTRKEKEAEAEPELSVETLLEATAEQVDENLEDIGYSEKSETRILIEKFVDENPEATALLLRNWLKDDWD